jgi:hypothetical protein
LIKKGILKREDEEYLNEIEKIKLKEIGEKIDTEIKK